MALRDVLVQFGVAVTGQHMLAAVQVKIQDLKTEAQKAGHSLSSFTGKLAAVGAVYAAIRAAQGVSDFVKDQIEQADALKHNAEKLGLTTDELQRFQYVAEQTGSSAEQVATGFRFFNRTLGEAQLGTKSAVKTFASLGLKIRGSNGEVKDTNELLLEFSDKLKAMPNEALRTAYAMRLLGKNGAALLPMLQKGGKELQDVFKDVDELGGGFNDKFIQSAHETDVQLKRLRFAWRTIRSTLANELLPIVKAWTANSIQSAKRIIEIAKYTYGFRTALIALGAGMAAIMAAFVLLNPLLLAAAVVIGLLLSPFILLYLAFDSFYTLMEGGDSVIGRFLDKMGGVGTKEKFVQALKAAFDLLFKLIGPGTDGIKKLGQSIMSAIAASIPFIIEWGGKFALYIIQAVDTAIMSFRLMGKAIEGVFKAMDDLAHGNFKDAWEDLKSMKEEMDAVTKGTHDRGEAYGKIRDVLDTIGSPAALKALPPVDQSGLAGKDYAGLPPPPPPINVKVTQHINGAKDPQAVADAANRGVSAAVKTATTRNRDAYDAVNTGNPGY